MTNTSKRLIFKTLIHLVCGLWLALTFYWGINDELGADPVEALINFTGIGAVNLLILSLLMSPLAQKLRQPFFIQSRRLIGLYSFTYAVFHLMSFLVFEIQLDIALFFSELIKRPYITVGMVVFSVLFLLAITSVNKIKVQMGKRWQKLHNWVYLALPLAILPYCWSIKLITLQPALYILVTAFVLWLKREKLFRRYKKKPGNKPGKLRALG